MRNAFSSTLAKLAKKDKDIYIVVADISPAGKMEDFQKNNKDRFINVGVAEQTMISVCAGLALNKKKPFAYTIAPFTLYRPFEMVRNDLCYQNLPVTIVGMGAGTIYANLGGTHLSQEDISISRSIPNMRIIAPCDSLELEDAVKFCSKNKNSPIYLRIGKSGEKNFSHNSKEKWKFGKIRKMCTGTETAILTFGPIIKMAFDIRGKLKKDIAIYNSHTLKPFDYAKLRKIFSKYKKIVVIEDHSEIGGLGSIVKEAGFIENYKGKIQCFSLKDKFIKEYFNQVDLIKKHGIETNKIIKSINKK